jgi:hypothetical protein
VPVEFLADQHAAEYAAFDGAPPRAELERFFFLDDADRELVEGKRRAHNRLGFAAQLTTVRYLGVFLGDPTDIPLEVAEYLAGQLAIADASVLKAYGEREDTRLDHVRELRRVLEYTEFAEVTKLLDGEAWEQVRPTVLASLNLPGEPGAHLAARAALLDGTYMDAAVTQFAGGRVRRPRRGRGPPLAVRPAPQQHARPVFLPAPRPAQGPATASRPGRRRRRMTLPYGAT